LNNTVATLVKWTVTILSAIFAGCVVYGSVHRGPPVTPADIWDLFLAILTTAGFGAGAKIVNKSIDKRNT